jgi:hypothetical protein
VNLVNGPWFTLESGHVIGGGELKIELKYSILKYGSIKSTSQQLNAGLLK